MARLGNNTQKYNPAKYLSRAPELELNWTDKWEEEIYSSCLNWQATPSV